MPALGAALGTRFCGNGDLLTFAVRSSGARAQVLEGSNGPVITSCLRVPDAVDGVPGAGRGYYVEDAGYPHFVSWMLQVADAHGVAARALLFARRLWRRVRGFEPDSDLGAEIAALFGPCGLSKGSLPMLGMGRDVPDGRMFLTGPDHLEVDWNVESSREYFAGVRSTMARVAERLGARFRDNPMWYLSRVITVHPLGGCPMARDPAHGVVDAWGEVFGHRGLFVADGSVMPGPVGPNPALTIAALADRFADRATERCC
jgi:cholesterol oxidase